MMKILFFNICILASVAAFAYSGGSGTEESPYLLSTESDLKELNNNINSVQTGLSDFYQLTNDIELTETWTPLGSDLSPFLGHFDGKGFGIKNLQIAGAEVADCGFFGVIAGATINNFRILSGTIVGKFRTGAIVGTARENSTLLNCANAAAVTGSLQIGGLVGNCENSIIENSFNIGTISVNQIAPDASMMDYPGIGGLIGNGEDFTLSSSYNSGLILSAISDKYLGVGGLVGNDLNQSTIENCYNVGQVFGGDYRGTTIGYLNSTRGVNIVDCVFDSQMVSGESVGKIEGQTELIEQHIESFKTQEFWNGSRAFGTLTKIANFYPHAGSLDDDLVKVSVLPLILPADETADNIATKFSVSGGEWNCSNDKIDFDGGITVDHCMGTDDSSELTVTVGDFSRQINVGIDNNCRSYNVNNPSETLCASELTEYNRRNGIEFAPNHFKIEKDFVLDTTITHTTIHGCDSVVTYHLTCYPLPVARRSADLSDTIRVLRGGSCDVKFDFENIFSSETSFKVKVNDQIDDNTSGGRSYSTTSSYLESDQRFQIVELTSGYTHCTATEADLPAYIYVKIVDEVNITLATQGEGTIVDANPEVNADGENKKTFDITPAAGYFLARLEVGLNEFARQDVMVSGGKMSYSFVPVADTKLTAYFEPIAPWNGSDVATPLESRDTIWIFEPCELAWFVRQSATNLFANKTILVMNDLDMSAGELPEITQFSGKFDTQCHTISTKNAANLFGNVAGELVGLPLNAGEIETDEQTVCADYQTITVNSLKPLSGGTNASYSWKIDGQNISSATAETLQIPANLSAGKHTITRYATSSCDNAELKSAGEFVLNVSERFAAGTIAAETKNTKPDYAAFVVGNSVAASAGSVYVWKENGIEIPGEVSETLAVAAAKSVGEYRFTRWAKNDALCVDDYQQSAGTYVLNVTQLETAKVSIEFNTEKGSVVGPTEASVLQPNSYTLTPNANCFVWQISSRIMGDLLPKAWYENGKVYFDYSPTADDVLTIEFRSIMDTCEWPHRPILSKDRKTAYAFVAADLAYVAQRLAPQAAQVSAGQTADEIAPDAVDWSTTNIELQANVDFGGQFNTETGIWNNASSWVPIGSNAAPFNGVFNGNCHIVRNLYCNAETQDNVGLFGVVGRSAELKHFAVVSGELKGRKNVAAVAAVNYGKIHHIYNMAQISAQDVNTGGIVGQNFGTIKYVYNSGLILSAYNVAGGIVGLNEPRAVVDSVYCISDVVKTTGDLWGALVGVNNGILTNAYWDWQMSAKAGTGDVQNAEKKDVNEMFSIFADDTENWVSGENVYPRLKCLDQGNEAIVSVTPIYMSKTPDIESVRSATREFKVSTDNGVAWSSLNTAWIKITGTKGEIEFPECDGKDVTIVAQLGNAFRCAHVNIPNFNTFDAKNIETKIDSACSVSQIKRIEGLEPVGGNRTQYRYLWVRTDESGDTVHEASNVANAFQYLPKVTEPGVYRYERYVKDGVCQKEWAHSGGVWTLVIIEEFETGKIESRTDTVCLIEGVEPMMDLIRSEQLATGGHSQSIVYRWTIRKDLALAASELPQSKGELTSSFAPEIGNLEPGTYTIKRQASDQHCADWIDSEGEVQLTLIDKIDVGSIRAKNEIHCLSEEASTFSIDVNNENAAKGGEKIEYRWEILIDGETQPTVFDRGQAESFRYDFPIPENASYPFVLIVNRYVRDNRCNLNWLRSDGTARYTLNREASSELTLNVCASALPYEYVYTYSDSRNQIVQFEQNGDSHTFVDKTVAGCDSVVTVKMSATILPKIEIADSNLVICESDLSEKLWFEIRPSLGSVSRYTLAYDDDARKAGFKDVTAEIPASGVVEIEIPAYVSPQIFTATLTADDGEESCQTLAKTIEFAVALDGYIKQKWNDVLVVYNVGNDEHPLKFNQFQWFVDNQKINGETLQHLYVSEGLRQVAYYAMLKGENGRRYRTCDFVPTQKLNAASQTIRVSPVPANGNETLQVELDFEAETLEGSSLQLFSPQGVKLTEITNLSPRMELQSPAESGIYLLRLTQVDGTVRFAKFMVK